MREKVDSERAINWLNQIPQEWTLTWDVGRRWGHMNINLAMSIKSILKKTRNFPLSVLVVKSTYQRCNNLFNQRGSEIIAMTRFGHVYTKILNKAMEEAQRKTNTHHVLEFD